MTALLLTTAAAFTALALFSPGLIHSLTRRGRLRHPHRMLLLIFRVWFGLLALATFWLLLSQLHSSR